MRTGRIRWPGALAGCWLGAVAGCRGVDTGRPEPGPPQRLEDNLLKTAPSPRYPADALLGPELRPDMDPTVARAHAHLRYLGLDVLPGKDRAAGPDAEAEPGKPLTLVHYWQVLRAPRGWRLFVHLSGPGNLGFVNADHVPVGGNHPIDNWQPGQIVRDEHRVQVPASFRQPELLVYVGLWQERGGRMKVRGPQDAEDRLLAARLPVRGVPRPPPLPELTALHSEVPVKVDGVLDDPIWRLAPASAPFVHPGTGAALDWETRVRAAWDEQFLYLAFDCPDEDIWGTFTRRDDPLWTQEAIEVFLDADGDEGDYIELQVSPRGGVFDSYLPGHRRNQNDWNSSAIAAVQVAGTLDDRTDRDQGWTVELALPWGDVQGRSQKPLRLPPEAGDVWRINFFRVDAPRSGPRASAWSPPLVGDFHALPRLGRLVFQITPQP